MQKRRLRAIAWRAAGLAVLAAPAEAAPPPIVVSTASTQVDVRDDGSSVRTSHIAIQVNTAEAATQMANQSVGFSPSAGDAEVLSAMTIRPDGTRVPLDPDAIKDLPVPGAAGSNGFSDRRQKQLRFALQPGDTLDYLVRIVNRPGLLAGQFMDSSVLAPSLDWRNFEMTITAPRAMPLVTETHDMEFTRTELGDEVRYRWDAQAESHPGREAISPFDAAPRLFASSVPDWADAGRMLAAALLPRAAVTDRVRALAEDITRGVDDRRAQAAALYDWMARHIRPETIPLGSGSAPTHDADTVMSRGHGDDEDRVVLFGALLAAKGIVSAPAMINATNSYTLSGPPTLAQLDHLISYVPELDLYADTGVAFTPFGSLPLVEYGKQVVVARDTGGEVRQVPVLPPGLAATTAITHERLDIFGTIIGATHVSATGPFATALRTIAAGIEAGSGERVAAAQLRAVGTEGQGSFTFAAPALASASYEVAGDFLLSPRTDLLGGAPFAPPPGLDMLTRPGDVLAGPLRLDAPGADAPTPCFSGRQVEEVTLELPADRRLQHLPPDLALTGPGFDYTTTWQLGDNAVTVRRAFVTNFAAPLCEGAVRASAFTALAAIRRDYQTQISLRAATADELSAAKPQGEAGQRPDADNPDRRQPPDEQQQ